MIWKKLRHTIWITFMMGMARTFGEYEISSYAFGFSYVTYRWRGRRWAIPTQPMEEEERHDQS